MHHRMSFTCLWLTKPWKIKLKAISPQWKRDKIFRYIPNQHPWRQLHKLDTTCSLCCQASLETLARDAINILWQLIPLWTQFKKKHWLVQLKTRNAVLISWNRQWAQRLWWVPKIWWIKTRARMSGITFVRKYSSRLNFVKDMRI